MTPKLPILLLCCMASAAIAAETQKPDGDKQGGVALTKMAIAARGLEHFGRFPFRSGSFSTTWGSLLPKQATKVREVQNYMLRRARDLYSTNPQQAEELKKWADMMERITIQVRSDPHWIWTAYSGGKPEMAWSRLSKRITIFENFWSNTMEWHLSPISHPNTDELAGMYAEVASAFIHEMRHVEGYREFDAYTYEWGLFKALGVPTQGPRAGRYKKVKSQLSTVLKARYDPTSDTWHRK